MKKKQAEKKPYINCVSLTDTSGNPNFEYLTSYSPNKELEQAGTEDLRWF